MNRPRTIPGLAAALLLAACEAAPPPPPAPVVSPPPVAAPAPAPPAVAPALAFDDERASAFARLSLECIGREYPNKPGDTLSGDPDVLPPRRLHPAFFGCFDWHSAVHGHWALTRILATRPGHPLAGAIRAALANSFTPEKLAGELAYFRSEGREIFERPYGWGWFLRLHAELVHAGAVDPELAAHARTLEPLARLFAERIGRYLERLSVPVRDGTHQNTAYALAHIRDWAALVGDTALVGRIDARARDFYLADTACPVRYEPSGEDFLSPCLAEAELLSRLLPAADLAAWLDRFLPPAGRPDLGTLAAPVPVKDKEDPRIGHLIGLSLHRAAALRRIASALPGDDPRRATFLALARTHQDDGVGQMFASGYGGAHWLASFAIFLFTEAGPYPGT